MGEPLPPLDGAVLWDMASIVVEAARLDCQDDGIRRVVGLVAYPDGPGQLGEGFRR